MSIIDSIALSWRCRKYHMADSVKDNHCHFLYLHNATKHVLKRPLWAKSPMPNSPFWNQVENTISIRILERALSHSDLSLLKHLWRAVCKYRLGGWEPVVQMTFFAVCTISVVERNTTFFTCHLKKEDRPMRKLSALSLNAYCRRHNLLSRNPFSVQNSSNVNPITNSRLLSKAEFLGCFQLAQCSKRIIEQLLC